MTNPTDPHAFDGCHSECRKAGAHTLRWGGCEHAPKPEPTVSMSKIYTDPGDGYPSIGFDSYTVDQLAELLDPVLGFEAVRARRGSVDLAHLAAHAIVHRNDDTAASVPSAPTQTADADRRDRYALSAMLWQIAEHHIVAEWICCEPINPEHDLCMQGDATLRMVKALLVDDPEAWRPAPLLDAVLAVADAEQADVRAAALREAADVYDRLLKDMAAEISKDPRYWTGVQHVATGLRRLADEEQQPETQDS